MKTYAITGVASGIGAEVAKSLKAEGHKVIGFDIADDAGLDLVRVTMAGIAVTDVPDGKHLVDTVPCELWA